MRGGPLERSGQSVAATKHIHPRPKYRSKVLSKILVKFRLEISVKFLSQNFGEISF